MKKIFFALAALVLAFTGCSQEEDAIQVSEKKAVKVVVNMDRPDFGEDTRAPRQGWEEGDEVVVNFGSPMFCLKLIYNGGAWTTETWVDEEYDGGTYTKGDSDTLGEILADFFSEDEEEDERSAPVSAVYFSSGVTEISWGPLTRAVTHGINIETNASTATHGECIMTCEDGTGTIKRTVDGYELILNITMIPRVAQFTIRDLQLTHIDDSRFIAIDGPVNMYAGGSIKMSGTILLNNWTEENESVGAFAHQNSDGISFYAVPWSSNEDMPTWLREWYEEDKGIDLSTETDLYKSVEYEVWFNKPNGTSLHRNFGTNTVEIGDAVIMDGPYTEDEDGNKTTGAQEWI